MKKRFDFLMRIRLSLFAAILIQLIVPNTLTGQKAERLISPGELSRVHAHLSGINNCDKCHLSGKKTLAPKCLGCHKELSLRIETGRGFHRDKDEKCAGCHPDHLGLDFSLIKWEPEEFPHEESGYPLTGQHAKVQNCQKCHNPDFAPPAEGGLTYLIADNRCITCHNDTHRISLGKDCGRCHSLQVPFKELSFDHDNSSFPLKGAHQNVLCAVCHRQKQWKGLDYDRCLDCHQDPHSPTLGKECASCHNENSWRSGDFNHDKTTYPLRGKHRGLECRQCHKSSTLAKLSFAECRDCHSRDPHQGQFSEDCGICHTIASFKSVRLDHQKTRYPLTGEHVRTACSKCHKAPRTGGAVLYKPISTGCQDCHADIHMKQLSNNCESCHSTRGFKADTLMFDHSSDSVYPLEGSHGSLECQKCHIEETTDFPAGPGTAVRYRPISSSCFTCHQDYHAGQLGTDCAACHNLIHFKPAPGFRHEQSRYSLTGIHDSVTCEKCHRPIQISINGNTVQTVEYKPLGFNCLGCHSDLKHEKTEFTLKGKHANAPCDSCHTPEIPNTVKKRGPDFKHYECGRCHFYRHPGRYLQCQTCHNSETWRVER